MYQSCDYKHNRLAWLFNHKEGFPAVEVTNLINFKISTGHPLGLLYCHMGQSTALLDNTQICCLQSDRMNEWMNEWMTDYYNPLTHSCWGLKTNHERDNVYSHKHLIFTDQIQYQLTSPKTDLIGLRLECNTILLKYLSQIHMTLTLTFHSHTLRAKDKCTLYGNIRVYCSHMLVSMASNTNWQLALAVLTDKMFTDWHSKIKKIGLFLCWLKLHWCFNDALH